jgi:hypothetical protein
MWVWLYEIRVGNKTVKRSDRDFNTQADALRAGVRYLQENPVANEEDKPEPVSVATIPQLVGGSLAEPPTS